MDKHVAALVLEEIGTLLEIRGEDTFRARAFYNAARALAGVTGDLAELLASGELAEVPGLGPATLEVVRELVETGGSRLHEALRSSTPPGLFDLLRLPGLGPKRVHQLYRELGIDSLDALERAAAEGRIARLAGFGPRTQAKLVEGLAYVRSQMGRRRQPEAWLVAEWLKAFLEALPGVAQVEVVGELRRRLETVRAVELVAAVVDGTAPVLDAFLGMPGITAGERVAANGARAMLADGAEARLICVPREAFIAALVHATGSASHVTALAARASERGLRLDEHGLWRGGERIPLEDEGALYRALGLQFVDPELREGTDEVALAATSSLPTLITDTDLRGCFHCHTTYSDGKSTLVEMATAARERGWRYLGIADHSQAAQYARGLSLEDLARQHDEIDAWNAEHGASLWLFKGIEADILLDGRLDYAELDDDVLGRFDYVVASVHSNFNLPESAMTERVLRALEDPHVTFLGHPTGRRLLAREGYKIDLAAVIEAAAERGVGIEINANPRRLDLDWRHWRAARAMGVRTAINPDAHSADALSDVDYGIGVARKGWLTAGDVVNTWPLDEVRRYFGRG